MEILLKALVKKSAAGLIAPSENPSETGRELEIETGKSEELSFCAEAECRRGLPFEKLNSIHF